MSMRIDERISAWSRYALLAPVVALVLSCGGGGGAGGDGNNDAFTVSPSSISFAGVQDTSVTPSAQTVTVTVVRGSVFFSDSGITPSGGFVRVSPINFTNQTTVQFQVAPDSPRTVGTFTGSVTVRGCANPTCSGSDAPGSPKVIPITYTVTPFTGLRFDPLAIDFVTRTGGLPASKLGSLRQSSGSSPWTASTSYTSGAAGWLSMSPPSGTLNPTQDINFNVTDTSSAEVREATVTFTAGALTKTVPVSLVINAPRANFVSPYVVPAGSAGNVIIRGYGFSTLAAGALQVRFGATPATTAFVSTDTEIGATYPALAAGSHAITLGDGSITLPSRPSLKLVAIDAPAYSAVAIPRPSSPGQVVDLIYDGERQAIYLMDANNRIERYTFVSGTTWNASSSVVGSGANAHIALAPDGTQLIKTNGTSPSLEVVDPVTLSSSTVAAAFTGLSPPSNLGSIAFANDGGAVGSANSPNGLSLYRYDMLLQRFTALSTFADLTNSTAFASGDRSALILPAFDPSVPTSSKLIYTYNANTGAVRQANASSSLSEHTSISRDGSRAIVISRKLSATQTTDVLDYDKGLAIFQFRGTLPAGLTGVVISPDGSTAYAYFSATNSIRKFDLSVPSGGVMPDIGGISVAASPGTTFNAMAITPDGGTLFLAGNQQLIVTPAP
jgi:hypothetical protein